MVDKIIRSKLVLLIFPFLLLTAALSSLWILSECSLNILTLLVLAFLTIMNVSPYVILLIVHYYRTKRKTGPLNYSYYTAFFLSLVVMGIAAFLVLRELHFARPGSQLAAYGFVLLPFYSAAVMLIAYMTGWTAEIYIRRRNGIYAAEDALKREAFRIHFSKYKKLYIIILLVVIAWIGIRLLPLAGFFPLPNIHLAAEMGNIGRVKHFLDKGVGINVSNEDGETPLHLAIFSGNKPLVEFLITMVHWLMLKTTVARHHCIRLHMATTWK
jgi:hypothetical protein